MQYIDHTIICLKDVEQARYVKLFLYIFEQMLGLKLDFEKSEILSIGGDNDIDKLYVGIFNRQIGIFPIRYLDVPISARRLKIIDWIKLEENLAKKLDVW
jgi:hypothetical protein